MLIYLKFGTHVQLNVRYKKASWKLKSDQRSFRSSHQVTCGITFMSNNKYNLLLLKFVRHCQPKIICKHVTLPTSGEVFEVIVQIHTL